LSPAATRGLLVNRNRNVVHDRALSIARASDWIIIDANMTEEEVEKEIQAEL